MSLMVEAASGSTAVGHPPERVSASTVRAIRLYHGWSPELMAQTFKLEVRTIYRWQYYGVCIENIKLDPEAHPASGPQWRRKLLIFLLDRYEKTAVTDNRQTEVQP